MPKFLWSVALFIAIASTALLLFPLSPNAAVIAQEAATGETYLAIRPSASSAYQTIALRLNDDGSAEMTTDFHNDEPAIVEIGTWQDNGDGTLTVTLTGREDETYDPPVVTNFAQDGDALISVDAEDRYGADGLRLRRASDIAQDLSKSLFTIDLQAGFALDPTFISVNAGGEVDASLLNPACRGFINRQPVVTINWSGEAEFVRTFFVSDSDPTLVVLTPDGHIVCNDDANRLVLDPAVQISNPVSGTYRIWIGSIAANQLIPGVLVMTTKSEVNLGTFRLGALIQRPVLAEPQVTPSPSNRETISAAIAAAAASAPALTADSGVTTTAISAEGTIPLFQLNLLNPQCSGEVSSAPDFVFNWTGPADQLSIFFEGDRDSTLLVVGAGGAVVACNDDTEAGVNVNPLVVLQQPPDGLYGVWVGRLDPTQPVTGTLTISPAADAAPAVLAPATTE